MNPELIDKIIKKIDKSIPDSSDDFVEFSDSRYVPEKISPSNFHAPPLTDSGRKIAFIDGGNCEILKAPNFSLHFVRIYSTVYLKNRRISSEKKEFYVFASAKGEDGKLQYNAEIFPLKGSISINPEELVFDSMDKTLADGGKRVSISRIGGVARRFAELREALALADKLETGDIIVMDGTLQSSVTNESKFFSELYNKASEKNIIITALSKTTNLLTKKGNAVAPLLSSISPSGNWFYFPVAEIRHPDHRANMYFVKLHEKSKYVFRFEVYRENVYDINDIFSALQGNSSDPVFLGYPYGMIEADKFARVQNSERDYIRTMLFTKSGRNWEKIQSFICSTDAHEILDNISW